MPQYKRITVFGGDGFIGKNLVYELAKTGCVITIPTRDVHRTGKVRPAGNVGQIVPMPCDIHSDDDVAAAIKDADAVVNLIGILYETRKSTFQAIHADFPKRLGALCKEGGVKRLVHISALGKAPKSSYMKSKRAGEDGLRETFPDSVILRPSVVFGPDDSFFNRFAQISLISPYLPLIGGGHTRFQPVYVGDIIDVLMLALSESKGKAMQGQVYELGGPTVYTFRDLMELMAKHTGRKRFLMSIPWDLAALKARFLEKLPNPMLTSDQLELLKSDNVVKPSKDCKVFTDLDITPTAAEVILPTYLDKYRAGGRFSRQDAAA